MKKKEGETCQTRPRPAGCAWWWDWVVKREKKKAGKKKGDPKNFVAKKDCIRAREMEHCRSSGERSGWIGVSRRVMEEDNWANKDNQDVFNGRKTRRVQERQLSRV